MPAETSPATLRLATRASRLALWQARHVRDLLIAADPHCQVQIVEISTLGDRDRGSRLAEMGGQGVFTREVQQAVLDGRADIAVHSLKDLPTETAEGLRLAGVPERAPRWDVFIAPRSGSKDTAAQAQPLRSLEDVPEGARIATGSLRRQAQLQHARFDLRMCEVRGNVETRLKKLDDGEFDLLILAEAGLQRLGLADRISGRLLPPVMFPAVGQAALGLECRAEDAGTIDRLGRITHALTLEEVLAERSCLRALRAGCHAPVGTLAARTDDGGLSLEAVVLSADGREKLQVREESPTGADPEALGQLVAEHLFRMGAERLLRGEARL